MVPRPRRSRLLDALRAEHGRAMRGGPPRDPWHAILWENVVYLTDDAHRDAALAKLRAATRLDADVLARVPDDVLLPICGLGRMAALCVGKLRECARCFDDVGDPRGLVRLPLAEARKALREFPGVGAPGADRLILFAGALPLVALESNGLRTLLRLGFGQDAGSYSAKLKSAIAAVAGEVAETCDARIEWFTLLRRHGQETCRATPNCAVCAVAKGCPSRRVAGGGRR